MNTLSGDEAFCTIITENYIHYALALHDSLIKHSKNLRVLYVLVSLEEHYTANFPQRENLKYLFVGDVSCDGQGKEIYEKYYNTNMDAFRWSMKPVLLKYLLLHRNCERALFLDCDLYFFNNYDFLFVQLLSADILLTPHWRSQDPKKDELNFNALIAHGLFNAGFVGVNKNSVEALDWWARSCEYACEIDAERGIYVDQGYLTALPVIFNNVEIVKHQGCNVAEWNIIECKRTITNVGDILINNKFPIIFIHFTPRTVKRIADGRDALLINHLSEYFFALYKYDEQYNLLLKAYKMEPDIVEKPIYIGFFNRVLTKLRLGNFAKKVLRYQKQSAFV